MKVKDHLELIKKPENMTQEEYENLDVLLLPGDENKEVMLCVKEDESGVCEFGEPCDREGNPLPDDGIRIKSLLLIIDEKENVITE